MDFKIKIDLTGQDFATTTPQKPSKRPKSQKKKDPKLTNPPNQILAPTNPAPKKKKPSSKTQTPSKEQNNIVQTNNNPQINQNSLLSLSLPRNDNISNDNAQKLSFINTKKPRHWEKRWVLVPNVFEFTKEIWLKKWVLVDDGAANEDEFMDNNVNLTFFKTF